MKSICISIFLMMILTSMLCGHDLAPPGWRGAECSTKQVWTFETNNPEVEPEIDENSYGPAIATVTLGDFSSGWLDETPGMGTQTGVWDLGISGSISLNIPNCSEALEYKEVWLQVTYYEDSLIPAPSIDVMGADILPEETQILEVEDTGLLGGVWKLHKSVWRIYPNPGSEIVAVSSDSSTTAMIDQVVIDTICVPEPMSFGLLLLGSFVLSIKKQRH